MGHRRAWLWLVALLGCGARAELGARAATGVGRRRRRTAGGAGAASATNSVAIDGGQAYAIGRDLGMIGRAPLSGGAPLDLLAEGVDDVDTLEARDGWVYLTRGKEVLPMPAAEPTLCTTIARPLAGTPTTGSKWSKSLKPCGRARHTLTQEIVHVWYPARARADRRGLVRPGASDSCSASLCCNYDAGDGAVIGCICNANGTGWSCDQSACACTGS